MITDWFNGVIEEDGEPAGFYFLSIEGKQAELELLYVSPIAMGKGYGKVLFQTAERLAVEHGCFCLRIEADPNAVGFYKRMGARQTGWARSEVDDVRELPLMEKNLCKV
jgi:GNAT superfamily N-acetyltransferase